MTTSERLLDREGRQEAESIISSVDGYSTRVEPPKKLGILTILGEERGRCFLFSGGRGFHEEKI